MSQVDALIITALKEEYEAARKAGLRGYADNPGIESWGERDSGTPTPYLLGNYAVADGAYMSVALARPTRMGSTATSSIMSSLVERLKPQCLAMCGVCAGNPANVALGDVIVAELAYVYDEGKRTEEGFEGDHRQIPLSDVWVRSAQDLSVADLPSYGEASDDEAKTWLLERLNAKEDPRAHPARARYFPRNTWSARIDSLEKDGFLSRRGVKLSLTDKGRLLAQRVLYDDVHGPEQLPFKVVVGPIASGNVVVKDGRTWNQLKQWGVRTVVGLEMEAAILASTAHRLSIPNWAVAKGVMDYADPRKDDRYKSFAARASAEVLFKLLALRVIPTESLRARKSARSRGQSPPLEPGLEGGRQTVERKSDPDSLLYATERKTLNDKASTAEPAQASHLCRVFLCHSSGDKPAVRRLYGRLRGEGFDVWLDQENILPGQDWDAEIRRAVRAADLVIVCLSKASIEKTGYIQREIRMVLDLADEQPEDKIYLIPARLELCDVPHRLTRWQWVDLFDLEGYNRLLSAVRTAAKRLDLPVTTGDLAAARRSLQNDGLVSPAGMRQAGATDLHPAPADDTLRPESGSAQESVLRPEPQRGQGFAEDTTLPRVGSGGGTGSSRSQSLVPTPSLPMLRDHEERLSAILKVIEMSPDTLDPQAGDVHQELVMPVYELMRTEVAQACGSRWDRRDRQRFAERYRAAANKWPSYREALAGLERARDLDTSVNDAMVQLERPRSDYIAELLSFCEEFFATLDFFFPT